MEYIIEVGTTESIQPRVLMPLVRCKDCKFWKDGDGVSLNIHTEEVMNRDKAVYLSDVLQILEDLEKEADRQGNYKGYIVLMDAAERVQKLDDVTKGKEER